MRALKPWVALVGLSLLTPTLTLAKSAKQTPMNNVTISGVSLGESLPEIMAKLGPPTSSKPGQANVVCPAGWDFSWPECEARLVADYSGLHVVSISGQVMENGPHKLQTHSSNEDVLGFVQSIPESTHVVDPALAWKEIHRCYGLLEDSEASVSWASLEVFVDKDGFAKAILSRRGKEEQGIPWPNLAEYQLRDPHVLDIGF